MVGLPTEPVSDGDRWPPRNGALYYCTIFYGQKKRNQFEIGVGDRHFETWAENIHMCKGPVVEEKEEIKTLKIKSLQKSPDLWQKNKKKEPATGLLFDAVVACK